MAMRSSDTIGAVAGIGALGLMGLLGFGLFQQSSKGGCDNLLYRGLHPGCQQCPDGTYYTTDHNDKVSRTSCGGALPGGSTSATGSTGSTGSTATSSTGNTGPTTTGTTGSPGGGSSNGGIARAEPGGANPIAVFGNTFIYSCTTGAPSAYSRQYSQVGYFDASGNYVNDGWTYAVYQLNDGSYRLINQNCH